MRRLPLLVLLGTAMPVYGQAVKGTLLGTVSDSSKAVVPEATVEITETNTGISRRVTANQSGYYVFADLESGVYKVAVEHPGFRRAVRERVDVLVNSTVRVDFELEAGTVSENVTVTAQAEVLQTDRSDTGRKIETKQLTDMPLLFNRNFQSLAALVPGAGRAFRPHSEFFNSQDSLSVHVNGQSRLANNVQIEGIDDNHRSGLLTVLIPPIEALATVDITTSNYEAELGRAGGAVTNVVLRSGTNERHGSAFEFNRESATAARNVFALGKAPTAYNQFGFTIGGPLRKNKTFFFSDYQGIRDHRGDVTLVTIPTMAFRNGDLSASPTVIYDPSTGAADGSGRQPFPNNIIPPERIGPIARRLLALLPPPTFPGLQTNFEELTTRVKSTDSFDAKVDHQIGPLSNVSVRYSFQEPRLFDPSLYPPNGGPKNGGFAGTGTNVTQSSAVNYTHIFNPSLVTEVRFGFSHYRNLTQQDDFGSTITKDLGIPGVNIDPTTSGLTTISVNGFSNPMLGFSANQPWNRAETNFNLVSNWTKVVDNHTVKWGVDLRRFSDDLLAGIFNPRGQWNFQAGPTARNGDPRTSFANAFASFLLDRPSSFVRDIPTQFSSIRQTAVFSYVQDKWQISPRLTVDLGVRHELWPPPTPQSPGGFSNYDPATNSLVVAGMGSNPSNLGRKTNWGNFGPRLGAAYRLNARTVLRAGYGISTIPFPDNSYAFNFPVLQNNAFNPPNSFAPAGSLAAGFPPPRLAAVPPNGIIANAQDDSYFVVPLDLKEAYLQSWNVAVQRLLAARFMFEAAYVGNHGVGILARQNLNASTAPGTRSAGQPLNRLFGRKAVTTTWIPTGTSYHSLQIKFDRRFSDGFLLTTAYTYSRSIDYSDDNGNLFNNINVDANRARSNFDRTHVFVQSYVYELPFGRGHRWLQSGPARWILGDWQINGIFTAQTGIPLDFTYDASTLNAPGNSNRPNMSGTPAIFGNVGKGQKWFDVTKFSAPASATFGNTGRNILAGPGFVNLDFSLFRRIPISERFSAEVRIESFNFTNTPHFNNPNTTFGSAGFGEITTAVQDQRQFQFGVKLIF